MLSTNLRLNLAPASRFYLNIPGLVSSMQNADVHIKRVKRILPEKGHIGIMTITDKQFGMMEIFYGKKLAERQGIPQQLELF